MGIVKTRVGPKAWPRVRGLANKQGEGPAGFKLLTFETFGDYSTFETFCDYSPIARLSAGAPGPVMEVAGPRLSRPRPSAGSTCLRIETFAEDPYDRNYNFRTRSCVGLKVVRFVGSNCPVVEGMSSIIVN